MKVPFEFEGKNYEVRVVSDGATIYIRTFLENKPVNGYQYQVHIETINDLERLIGLDAISELIEVAKQDVRDKKWEKLMEVLKQ